MREVLVQKAQKGNIYLDLDSVNKIEPNQEMYADEDSQKENHQINNFLYKQVNVLQNMEDRTITAKTMDSSIFVDLRKLAIAEKDDKAELVKLEQFCDAHNISTIIDFVNRHRSEVGQYKEFFERCIKNVNLAKVDSLKLLLSVAMIYGNPLFNSIPKIIQEA